MEIKCAKHRPIGLVRFGCCILLLMIIGSLQTNAQQANRSYGIRNGKMHIEIGKKIKISSLDSFIIQYNLGDIGLHQVIMTGSFDSLKKLGWNVALNNKQMFVVEKPLMSVEEIVRPEGRIMFTEKHPTLGEMFPAVNNGILFGSNRFRNKYPFAQSGGTVTFFLRNNLKANRVMLAGSFNQWQPSVLSMTRTDSGWIANVSLLPGKYWYKFIADGRWMVDDDNQLRENDGKGNINSVFYVTNFVFKLEGFSNAKRVYLSGSFNNWRTGDLQMLKTGDGWQLPMYLAEGTHTYRYVVDGKWMADPGNKEKFPNEYGEFNSVIRIGTPYVFKLTGYTNANRVFLAGSFNRWRKDELLMIKTSTGWELPYVIGPGNYDYAFIVDGKQVADFTNPLIAYADHQNPTSFMIVDPNYTFHLHGYPDAKKVFLAGDFNNWNPTLLPMKKVGDDWVFGVHLSVGKHLYKFVVDDKWIIDPANKLWEQNEYGTGNSILWFEK